MTENLGLIIVDFLTLIKSERKYDSRNLEVGAISRELKLLAKELKIPIIALSQLNRNAADTSRPTLAELRDSGELEGRVEPDVLALKVVLLVIRKIVKQVIGVGLGLTGVKDGARPEKTVWFQMICELDQMVLSVRR